LGFFPEQLCSILVDAYNSKFDPLDWRSFCLSIHSWHPSHAKILNWAKTAPVKKGVQNYEPKFERIEKGIIDKLNEEAFRPVKPLL
jgi:hypothetical protein